MCLTGSKIGEEIRIDESNNTPASSESISGESIVILDFHVHIMQMPHEERTMAHEIE